MPRRLLDLIRADDPETGWLVRVVLTVALTWSLLFYPGRDSRYVVPALAVSYACWLFWVAAEHRRPRPARIALAVAAVLTSGASVALLRTAREALTNAARHAPVAPVTVTLSFLASSVRLVVVNAFSGDVPDADGFGLIGARERLALVGGTLSAGVEDGMWRMAAEVPG